MDVFAGQYRRLVIATLPEPDAGTGTDVVEAKSLVVDSVPGAAVCPAGVNTVTVTDTPLPIRLPDGVSASTENVGIDAGPTGTSRCWNGLVKKPFPVKRQLARLTPGALTTRPVELES
jgi:hypothetical protein